MENKEFMDMVTRIGPKISEWSKVRGWFVCGVPVDPNNLSENVQFNKLNNGERLFFASYGDGETHRIPQEARKSIMELLDAGSLMFDPFPPVTVVTLPLSISDEMSEEPSPLDNIFYPDAFDPDDSEDEHELLRTVYKQALPHVSEYLQHYLIIVVVAQGDEALADCTEVAMFSVNMPFSFSKVAVTRWLDWLDNEDRATLN